MEKFKKMLPAILMIIFEIAVGILLLIDPEKFTTTVFIIFGIVLIACAVVLLIRYLKERKAAEKVTKNVQKQSRDANKSEKAAAGSIEAPKVSVLPLIAAIATFVVGAVFAFGSQALYEWTALLMVIYGAIMIVKGIFKIADYVSLRKEGVGVSVLRLIVGILSVGLGIVMMIFNRDALDAMFKLAAISLLVEAALDIATVIMGVKIAKALKEQAEEEEKKKQDEEKKEKYDLDNFAE